MSNPRNKPCPCNSGKKFKKCCWNPVAIVPAMIQPVTPTEAGDVKKPRAERKPSPIMALAILSALAMSGERRL